jgi:hypothetical protein
MSCVAESHVHIVWGCKKLFDLYVCQAQDKLASIDQELASLPEPAGQLLKPKPEAAAAAAADSKEAQGPCQSLEEVKSVKSVDAALPGVVHVQDRGLGSFSALPSVALDVVVSDERHHEKLWMSSTHRISSLS